MDEVKTFIKEKFNETEIYIKDKLKSHPNHLDEDKLLEKIEEIFHGKIGEKPEEKILNDCKEEAKKKYEVNTGIGHQDKDKNGDNKYGDYFIWKEIISKSKHEAKPVIFVTNENKDDWWLKLHGKKIGIRYEHREEFFNETGQEIIIYSLNLFLEKANNYLNNLSKVSPPSLEKLINEIEKINEFKQLKNLYEKNYKNNEFLKKLSENNYINKEILEYKKMVEFSNKFLLNNKIDNLYKKINLNFDPLENRKDLPSSEDHFLTKNELLIGEKTDDKDSE